MLGIAYGFGLVPCNGHCIYKQPDNRESVVLLDNKVLVM
jgi:hypothetical protein